jgi:hypothetical protein
MSGGSFEKGKPWFRVWAAETLLSDDLEELSDHEYRVWWQLLCVASLAEVRWVVRLDESRLAKRCHSTPAKLRGALLTFRRLGMVEDAEEGWLLIVNGERYNPIGEERGASAERMRRLRSKRVTGEKGDGEGVTASDASPERHVVSHVTRLEEEEKKKRSEQRSLLARAGAGGDLTREPDPERIAVFEGLERAGYELSIGDLHEVNEMLDRGTWRPEWFPLAVRETGSKGWRYMRKVLQGWEQSGPPTRQKGGARNGRDDGRGVAASPRGIQHDDPTVGGWVKTVSSGSVPG